MSDFIFGGSKITADGDCSHEIKRCLLLGRKVITNLDSILKSRDITLPTKVHLVKAMVFPVVMYGPGKEQAAGVWETCLAPGWPQLRSGLPFGPRSQASLQKAQVPGVLSLLHSPTLTSIHDYWKNHCLDETNLCWQSNVSAF